MRPAPLLLLVAATQRQQPRRIDANDDGLPLCDAGAVERQLIESGGGPGTLFRNGFDGP